MKQVANESPGTGQVAQPVILYERYGRHEQQQQQQQDCQDQGDSIESKSIVSSNGEDAGAKTAPAAAAAVALVGVEAGSKLSPAMSRMLAVDADNYMLRKGTSGGSNAGGSATNSAKLAAIAERANNHHNNNNNINNINNINNLSRSHSRCCPFPSGKQQRLSAASLSVNSSFIQSTDSKFRAQINLSNNLFASISTQPPPPPPPPLDNSQCYDAAGSIVDEICNSGNNKVDKDEEVVEGVEQVEPGTISDNYSVEVSCARPLSFHRHMCWCDGGDGGGCPPEKKQRATGTTTRCSDVCVNLKETGVAAAAGGQVALSKNGIELLSADGERKISESICNSQNLCCCMCGSLCSSECHACFHRVCGQFSGQHLCQWTNTKGHASPGQVFDKEKVSFYI